MNKLTEQQAKDIKILASYPEFKSLQEYLSLHMFELATVNDITGSDPLEIATQTLSKQKALEMLTTLFDTIEVVSQEKAVKDNTYE